MASSHENSRRAGAEMPYAQVRAPPMSAKNLDTCADMSPARDCQRTTIKRRTMCDYVGASIIHNVATRRSKRPSPDQFKEAHVSAG